MSGFNGLPGPGSQPHDEDGAEFAYMEMPKGMRTYAMPEVPEKEDAQAFRPALLKLDEVLDALRAAPPPGTTVEICVDALNAANRDFIGQLLGEGEVSIIAGPSIQAQESVLAGVWRLHEVDENGTLTGDRIEAGDFPASVLKMAQEAAGPYLCPVDGVAAPNLMNAPAIATELAEKLAAYRQGDPAHVINLSLLPLTEEDSAYLDGRLGQGAVTILSRGYGNCRISSTAVKNAWWVRYFNSREALILNTIEIATIPAVGCAAKEDLEDSAERLAEILGVYR
ncbi:MAG: hydrogenase expression/formation protein [Rhodomicrobium sp.]|nr:hydrogenase expression/formation protein [Rhodomicrobium sp.]